MILYFAQALDRRGLLCICCHLLNGAKQRNDSRQKKKTIKTLNNWNLITSKVGWSLVCHTNWIHSKLPIYNLLIILYVTWTLGSLALQIFYWSLFDVHSQTVTGTEYLLAKVLCKRRERKKKEFVWIWVGNWGDVRCTSLPGLQLSALWLAGWCDGKWSEWQANHGETNTTTITIIGYISRRYYLYIILIDNHESGLLLQCPTCIFYFFLTFLGQRLMQPYWPINSGEKKEENVSWPVSQRKLNNCSTQTWTLSPGFVSTIQLSSCKSIQFHRQIIMRYEWRNRDIQTGQCTVWLYWPITDHHWPVDQLTRYPIKLCIDRSGWRWGGNWCSLGDSIATASLLMVIHSGCSES